MHVRFCGVPRQGFWMLHGNASALEALFPWVAGGVAPVYNSTWAARDSNPIFQAGPSSSSSALSAGEDWELTGFMADLAVNIMSQEALRDFTFSVFFFPTYTQSLYATAKLNMCDMTLAPFTVTPHREYCEPFSLLSGVEACTNPLTNTSAPSDSDACCARFTPQVLETTVDLLLRAQPDVSLMSQIGIDGNVGNLFLALLLLEIIIAHLVWLTEILNNKSHQFSRQYVTGIASALYFALITITTVGYGDTVPVTALGKLITIVGLIVGVVITALMTGTIASNLNAYRLDAQRYQINSMGDIQEGMDICTPSSLYLDFPAFDMADIFVPTVEDRQDAFASCVESLNNGDVSAVANDRPVLINYLLGLPAEEAAGLRIVEGANIVHLAPAISQQADPTLQSLLQTAYANALRDPLFYYPAVNKYFEADHEHQDEVLYNDSLNLVTFGIVIGYFSILVIVGIVHCVKGGGLRRVFLRYKRGARGLNNLVTMEKALAKTHINRKVSRRDTVTKKQLSSADNFSTEEQIQMIFEGIDLDGKGYIKSDDVMQLIRSVVNSQGLNTKSDNAKEGLDNVLQIKRFLRHTIESDLDGKVYLDEFRIAYLTTLKMPSARRLLFAVTALPAKAVTTSVTHQQKALRNKFGDGDGSRDVVAHIASIQSQITTLQQNMLLLKAKGSDVELTDRYQLKPRQPKASPRDHSVVHMQQTTNTIHANISKAKLVVPHRPPTKVPHTKSMLPARTVVNVDDAARQTTLKQPAGSADQRMADVKTKEAPSLLTPTASDDAGLNPTATSVKVVKSRVIASSASLDEPASAVTPRGRKPAYYV